MGTHSNDRQELTGDSAPSPRRETAAPVPIAALATASGRGAIGVVRVSGTRLGEICERLTAKRLTPRQATYGPFLDHQGEPIDFGLAIWFPGPDSYTGEDVLELQGHGGPVVMQLLLSRVLQAGGPDIRIARPGEFTERAFLNNKMDLAQAEAVADLIDASSAQAARGASRSLAGEFSERVSALVAALTHLRMLIEATLDFPEEEIDVLKNADASGQLTRLQADLATLLRQAGQGVLLRDGLNVVIAGAPNVGKSSLLNALAGAEAAIVSDVAGTTRDRIDQAILIDGVPINIVDTAGLHDTDDHVEQLGIDRTHQAIGNADVVLAVDVATRERAAPALDKQVQASIESAIAQGAHLIRVHNKADLVNESARVQKNEAVWLSAKTSDGVNLLRAQLLSLAGWQGGGESQFIARERHLQALQTAQQHLDQAESAWQGGLELLAEELRLAQIALNEITGEFSADDLLGVIFSRFCIGK